MKVADTPVACCGPLDAATLSDDQADATARLFKALADPTRVRLVNLLANSSEPVCVCEMNVHFDIAQPTLSHHLKKLVDAGLLAREQRGTWAYFSVEASALRQLSDVMRPKEVQV
ncbi:MAG: helix-turn-helix transcriptional regulator [Actinobacteria bacterium]|nr:helix-turn-helix transcriptional regulator [Actinomycetota bacterium]